MAEYTTRMNAFLTTLVNKIAYQEVRTKVFQNKLARFKKSDMPLGYSAEFSHVNPVELSDYTRPDAPAYTDPFGAAEPTVFATYLEVNEDKIASTRIDEMYIDDAFTSYEKIDNMVAAIVNSLYSGNQIWEYNLFKKVLAGGFAGMLQVEIPQVNSVDTGAAATVVIQDNSEYMAIPSDDYNSENGAISFVEPENQILIMTANFKHRLDNYSRALAYHNEPQNILPEIVVIDQMPTGMENVVAVLMDKAYLQIKDKKFAVDSIWNPADHALNYWLRRRTLAGTISFANVCAFVLESENDGGEG